MSQGMQAPPEAEEAETEPSLSPGRNTAPTPCFWPQEIDFRFLTPKVTQLCSLEPPSLGSSVPAGLGHTHHICANPQTFHPQGAESSPLL